MGTGRPRAKGAGINKPKYSGDSGAAEVVVAHPRCRPGESQDPLPQGEVSRRL